MDENKERSIIQSSGYNGSEQLEYAQNAKKKKR